MQRKGRKRKEKEKENRERKNVLESPISTEISSKILQRTYRKHSGPLNRPKPSSNEENP